MAFAGAATTALLHFGEQWGSVTSGLERENLHAGAENWEQRTGEFLYVRISYRAEFWDSLLNTQRNLRLLT